MASPSATMIQHPSTYQSPPHKRSNTRNDGACTESASPPSASSTQVAHTLTACTRCRQRKTRCDPALPKCTPCERTNSICEYYDAAKGKTLNRAYVVHLQHKVAALEEELRKVENEDSGDDPESMMGAATVRMQDATDSKYLGPSSGIAITRLVMQLAKQFTDAKSIKEIVSDQRAAQVKDLYRQEEAKPTSKVYPLISDVAAVKLPSRDLTDSLVQLYKSKVQPMYPILHEPTMDKDIQAVYDLEDGATPYQNFVFRMVVAIGMQKLDTKWAGLADSYYLAALKYLEQVVQPMNLSTLQCFGLMAEYSLLTPTRTAIYYIMGIAIRLAQALGIHEEKTITRGKNGRADPLEIDMRRRIFWSIFVMDCGLGHALGRPIILATDQEHIDVGWFETCNDQAITTEGINRDPNVWEFSTNKWLAIHFFKMRLLQLEIIRKLYQRKHEKPDNDNDPWFLQMEAKMDAWKNASPKQDVTRTGLDNPWFTGRYNTIVVLLYRPSPQVPRPSLQAALKCFEACKYNIYLQRAQIDRKNVDLTWIFTQSIFMAINTMLWSLSYVEVRRQNPRADVEQYLNVAMDAIQLASERWPGVATAVQLYYNLINAVLKIYEKDGDVPISAATPSDLAASPSGAFPDAFTRSSATSPITVSSTSVATPPEKPQHYSNPQHSDRSNAERSHASSQASSQQGEPYQNSHVPNMSSSTMRTTSADVVYAQQTTRQPVLRPPPPFDPSVPTNPLPDWIPEFASVPLWSTSQPHAHPQHTSPQIPLQSAYDQYNQEQNNAYAHPVFDPNSQAYPFPSTMDQNTGLNNGEYNYANEQFMWDMDTAGFGSGLTQLQQEELMQSLETDGMEDIQSMITATLNSMAPKAPPAQQRPSY